MMREEMAKKLLYAADNENSEHAREILRALARELRAYNAQTHTETYALEEIFESVLGE